jgi:REP element-mobilizing transposase RayT
MPKARKTQISLEATPYYHCVSRCVRRAFLCGEDAVTGQNYEHRRQWIEDKLLQLAQVFALDICAYAVMSNHYHVVLHVDQAQAENWTFDEVIDRWHQLFSGCVLSQRYVQGQSLGQAEMKALNDVVNEWRDRLMDISWFMRVMNESIARQANAEDDVTGRFWEGRFKSQALLDEAALAACMAYVDLNPIRAKLAETPETSDHTSIQRRISKAETAAIPNHPNQQPRNLLPFAGNPRKDMPRGLPFRLEDYLQLVDWTGRIMREDKRGAIPETLPPILERLNIEPQQWLYLTNHFESRFKSFVGGINKLKSICEQLGYQRNPGASACADCFP